jgi:hypothetical protein
MQEDEEEEGNPLLDFSESPEDEVLSQEKPAKSGKKGSKTHKKVRNPSGKEVTLFIYFIYLRPIRTFLLISPFLSTVVPVTQEDAA